MAYIASVLYTEFFGWDYSVADEFHEFQKPKFGLDMRTDSQFM